MIYRYVDVLMDNPVASIQNKNIDHKSIRDPSEHQISDPGNDDETSDSRAEKSHLNVHRN